MNSKNSQTTWSDASHFIVDLDQPPSERWKHILDVYKPLIRRAHETIWRDISQNLGIMSVVVKLIVNLFMWLLCQLNFISYVSDLKAVAEHVQISFGLLVALQFAYEASASCTSLLVNLPSSKTKSDSVDNGVLHARTMDWELNVLKDLTIEVTFCRNGRPLFTTSTWAGYVGCLTGMKPDSFTISVNYRLTKRGSLWWNLVSVMTGGWSVGFLVRNTLETCATYEDAVNVLATRRLVAPCYFTLSGPRCGEGCVITRDRLCEVRNRRQQLRRKEKEFIVQTNIDHWSVDEELDVLYSLERRHLVTRLLHQVLVSSLSTSNIEDESDIETDLYNSLLQILSTPPILNEETIYASVMNCRKHYCRTHVINTLHQSHPPSLNSLHSESQRKVPEDD